MSVNEENEILEEGIVQNEPMGVVTVENKKAKMTAMVKTGLKVAGVAAVGVIGFLLGKNAGSKKDKYEAEIIESEIIDSDVE